MVRKKITLDCSGEIEPLFQGDRTFRGALKIEDFFNLHGQFITMKELEGLAPRTISDHIKHMGMFKKHILEEQRFSEQNFVEIGVFYEYIAHMKLQK